MKVKNPDEDSLFNDNPIKGNDESLESTGTDWEDNQDELEDDMREIRTSDDVNEPDPEDTDFEVEPSEDDSAESEIERSE